MKQDQTMSAGVLLSLVMHSQIQGGRGARDACPPRSPNFFIFMQFLATNLQNNRLAHPLLELPPPSGNPGSATVMCTIKRCQRENFIQFTCQNGHPSSTIVILRGLPLISAKRDVTIHGNLTIYHLTGYCPKVSM